MAGRVEGASIFTPRLELRPLTFAAARAMEQGPEALADWLGCTVAEGWFDSEFVRAAARLVPDLAADRGLADWTRLVLDRGSPPTLVGSVGFLARPDVAGVLEIGFETAPGLRGGGYATEASAALVAWAFEHGDVARLAAVCFDDNFASAAVLRKIGFRRVAAEACLIGWELSRGDWRRLRAS